MSNNSDLNAMYPEAVMKRDQTRYKPRHAWYLADAQLLVRELQAACWPLFHHVALGGGVLNHGYSDKDVDIYVLPNYKPDVNHQKLQGALRDALETILGRVAVEMDLMSDGHGNDNWTVGSCFAQSLRFNYGDSGDKFVDVFIVQA